MTDKISRFDLLLFDFDGTIADTLPICFASFRAVFEKFNGTDLSDQAITAWFGPSETGIIRRHLADPADYEAAVELYYATYEKLHDELVKADPQISKMLENFRTQGKKMAVVTGKARRSFDISMEKLGLLPYFSYSVTGDDTEHPKPDPEGLQDALSYFKCLPGDAVYFGDADADVLAAKNADIASVGVAWFAGAQMTVSPDLFSKIPLDLFE